MVTVYRRPPAWKPDLLQADPPSLPPHPYFMPRYLKGTALPALALNISIGRALWGAESSDMDIIHRDTELHMPTISCYDVTDVPFYLVSKLDWMSSKRHNTMLLPKNYYHLLQHLLYAVQTLPDASVFFRMALNHMYWHNDTGKEYGQTKSYCKKVVHAWNANAPPASYARYLSSQSFITFSNISFLSWTRWWFRSIGAPSLRGSVSLLHAKWVCILGMGLSCLQRASNCAVPPLVNSVTSIGLGNEVKLAAYSGSSGYTNKPSFIPLFFISLDRLDWTLMLFCFCKSWYFRSFPAIIFNCILYYQYWLWVAFSFVLVDEKVQCMPARAHNGHMRETRGKGCWKSLLHHPHA